MATKKTRQHPTGNQDGKKAKKDQSERQTNFQGDEKERKLSGLDAAAKLLAEVRAPMTCQEMIKGMAERGYWTSPGGQTPHATLYSAILRELKAKGDAARFRKIERGKFAANKAS
jgi:hypothetical protein